MTVQQIIDRIRRQTEESSATYTDAVLIDYINDALDDLTPVAKMLDRVVNITLTITNGSATIIIHNGVPLDVAHEFLNVYFTSTGGEGQLLRRLPMSDMISCGWKLTADDILLQKLPTNSGTADVEFYRKLAHVSEVTDVPEMPDQYHNLLVLYGCAKIQERETAVTIKRDFANEYAVGKQTFALQRIWDMEPHHRPLIRQARVLGLLGVSSRGR